MTTNTHIELAEKAIAKMRAHGADAADVLVSDSAEMSVSCRMGRQEDIERAESRDIGLRAIIGKKGGNGQAFISGTGAGEAELDTLAARVVAMAQAAPADPYCGLADASGAAQMAALDLNDPQDASMEKLQALAAETEDAARAQKGITNSEGAGAAWGRSTTSLVTSNGFFGQYTGSHFSLGCAVIAGAGAAMERDYASHSARHFADLDAPEAIGTLAATRTLERLNPRKIDSQTAHVVFHPRVAGSLLGHLAAAISGNAIARGTSFLREARGEKIMPSNISVIDDPTRPRGLASADFDGEGLVGAPQTIIANGVLQCWLLDSASARQLDMASNARAARGIGTPPSPSATNLHLAAGQLSPEELLRDIGRGFFVTELIGMGVNGITGDYSRGASGFWIENGEIAYAVSEVTIADNLKNMFGKITAANDLAHRRAVNAPTLCISDMTLAGL